MKLEVGMYCYNKINRKFGIGKIIEIRQHNNYVIEYKNGIALISSGNVVASFNPIDLIEVGDYVNGIRIDSLSSNRFTGAKAVESNLLENDINRKCYFFENEDIKTILTKEQFENNCYILQDEEVK